jgi:NAD(P)-dependent dehydrogenase (short-subunit alcohol dehydrogenase family)
MTGAHWDRILDVNLVGVVNGLLAAYPRMVEQGHGQIVNTASGAGLAAPPFVTAYAATKHAVVGLSTGLRPEAALHGVRVNVLCPGSIDTAILDRAPDADLPASASALVTGRTYLNALRQKPVPVERVAGAAVRRMAANRAVIVVPAQAKALWYVQRLSPGLLQRALRPVARKVQRDLIRPAVPGPRGG